MSKIKRGILGGMSGKIANVVGSSWKGIATLRALPLSVANPRTAAQQAQRNAFSQCVAFATQITGSILRQFWNQYASQQSGYNLFISRNVANFDASGLVTPGDLLSTIGPITPAPIFTVSANAASDEVTINWTDNSGEGTAQGTDEAIIVIQNENTGDVFTSVGTITRADATATVTGVTMATGNTINVWLSFYDANNRSGEPDYANTNAV